MVHFSASNERLHEATYQNTLPQPFCRPIFIFWNFRVRHRRANHCTGTFRVRSSPIAAVKYSKPTLLLQGTTVTKFKAVDRDGALAIEELFELNVMTQNLNRPRLQMLVLKAKFLAHYSSPLGCHNVRTGS
jgi:hypothetical protein